VVFRAYNIRAVDNNMVWFVGLKKGTDEGLKADRQI
jgi:hypothetical protein